MICKKCGKIFVLESAHIKHESSCLITQDDIIKINKLYHEDHLSTRDIQKYGYSRSIIYAIIKKRRSFVEYVKYRKPVKMPESAKLKLRIARLRYLKEHPFDNAWKRTNISYLEKLFFEIIKNNNLADKYDIVHNYYQNGYYLDFAFLNIKLDVEVDGSQHFTEDHLIADNKRDAILISNGWKVYRIPQFKIMKEFKQVEKEILEALQNIQDLPSKTFLEKEVLEYRDLKAKNEAQKGGKRARKKQTLFETRKKLIENVDFSKRKWIQKVVELWGVATRTCVRHYMRRYFPEILKNAAKYNILHPRAKIQYKKKSKFFKINRSENIDENIGV